MVHSRFFLFAFLALFVILADVVSDGSIWSPTKGTSLCCKDHPEFGVCSDRSCKKWCLQGCDNKKGGFCKNKICHCYC
ncbi:putative defensin-like protein 27 [Eutrema salsugineum]|uniref:putative defensin-like protein 27 n=1 Tax=Eutrema salsugineum TaxID=72664 RepID=UPI000CED03BD|nr:putative defensin-like protein 27 [Eutrema salsugineum]